MLKVGKLEKSREKLRKVVPFEHKYGTDGKCWQKLTKARKCWQKMLKVGKVAKCREQLRKVEKIWEKLANVAKVAKSLHGKHAL